MHVVLLPHLTRFPLKARKPQGTSAKCFMCWEGTRGRARCPSPPAAPTLVPPVPQAQGKEKEHRIYLPFGVKVGVLLPKPMKGTAYSVPENLPFYFLPDTISPIRIGATRQSGRGKLPPIPNSWLRKKFSFFFPCFLNFPINGREENIPIHKSHPKAQSTQLGNLTGFVLHSC